MGECVLPTKICVKTRELDMLKTLLKKYHVHGANTDAEVIEATKKLLNVTKEHQIWQHPYTREMFGYNKCSDILDSLYKPYGPYNTTELLSNDHIDTVLHQWQIHSQELFNKKFLHKEFQTVDFDKLNTSVYKLSIDELLQYDMAAIVFNTDVSTGPGLHWICVVIDNNKKRIEFFNSSSNLAPTSLHQWMLRLWYDLRDNKNLLYDTIRAVERLPIQLSETECGVWCLCYIRSRLLGYSPKWITTKTDEHMINRMRNELFRSY